ncbi:MAG: hypothetical protein R3F11_27860 [Verrucomicrobiales bacterium]
MLNVIHKNPVVRTEAELQAEYERTKSFPTDRGVFLLGTVEHWKGEVACGAALPTAMMPPQPTTYFRLPGARLEPEAHPAQLLPASLRRPARRRIAQPRGTDHREDSDLELEGAPPPLSAPALFHGDSVVVWGRPVSSVDAKDGTAPAASMKPASSPGFPRGLSKRIPLPRRSHRPPLRLDRLLLHGSPGDADLDRRAPLSTRHEMRREHRSPRQKPERERKLTCVPATPPTHEISPWQPFTKAPDGEAPSDASAHEHRRRCRDRVCRHVLPQSPREHPRSH